MDKFPSLGLQSSISEISPSNKLASKTKSYSKPNAIQGNSNEFLSKDQPFTTNKTIKYFQGTNKVHYYLTSYVRVKVISISGVDYQEMSANLNCQFYIDISYRNLLDDEKKYMLRHGIRISFQADQSLLLTRQNADVSVYDNENEKKVSYIVRKFVKTRVNCSRLIISPFQLATCQISLKINKLKIVKDKQENNLGPKSSEIHFNMMDHNDMHVKISSSFDSSFGLFQIASLKLNAYYSTRFCQPPPPPDQESRPQKKNIFRRFMAKKVSKKVSSQKSYQILPLIKRNYGQEKLAQFNVANFDVPLYKDPSVAILTIFLPLLILGIINLGVFYQQPELPKRITSIAAIMVSIIALIPTIRQQIPPTQQITLVEILVLVEAGTALLALFQSISIDGVSAQQFQFNGFENGFFMVSAIITGILIIIISVLLILFFCKWKPTYADKSALQVQQFMEEFKINIYEWRNKECDAYFYKYFQAGTIQILQDVKEKENVLTKNIFKIGIHEDKQQMQRDRAFMEKNRKNNLPFEGIGL